MFLKLILYLLTEKEEEAARSVRREQNAFSVEDVKKDFVKVLEQSNYLEEKLVSLQKFADSTSIESKNKCKQNKLPIFLPYYFLILRLSLYKLK